MPAEPSLPSLVSLSWRVDVALASSAAKRALRPALRLRAEAADGQGACARVHARVQPRRSAAHKSERVRGRASE